MSDLLTQLEEVKCLVISKHQAGRHDQSAHTPKKYGGAANRSDYVAHRKSLGTDIPLTAAQQVEFESKLDSIHPAHVVGTYDDLSIHATYKQGGRAVDDRGYIITPDGQMVDLYAGLGHGETDHSIGAATVDNPGMLGMSDRDANNLLAATVAEDWDSAIQVWNKAYASGAVRVRVLGDETSIQTGKADNRTLRKLQGLYDDDKLNMSLDRYHYWGAGAKGVEFTTEEFLMAKYVNQLEAY
jgi:hypothetical protein